LTTADLPAREIGNMVETGWGFGASAIRQGKLIFAVGHVTAVPLGFGISARMPSDLLEEAQAVFRRRDSEFEFLELPIELCIGDTCRIIYRGHVQMAGYHVRIENVFRLADGAPPECVSISLDEAWQLGGRERDCSIAQILLKLA
jgi:hypothetical protein